VQADKDRGADGRKGPRREGIDCAIHDAAIEQHSITVIVPWLTILCFNLQRCGVLTLPEFEDNQAIAFFCPTSLMYAVPCTYSYVRWGWQGVTSGEPTLCKCPVEIGEDRSGTSWPLADLQQCYLVSATEN